MALLKKDSFIFLNFCNICFQSFSHMLFLGNKSDNILFFHGLGMVKRKEAPDGSRKPTNAQFGNFKTTWRRMEMLNSRWKAAIYR